MCYLVVSNARLIKNVGGKLHIIPKEFEGMSTVV